MWLELGAHRRSLFFKTPDQPQYDIKKGSRSVPFVPLGGPGIWNK